MTKTALHANSINAFAEATDLVQVRLFGLISIIVIVLLSYGSAGPGMT